MLPLSHPCHPHQRRISLPSNDTPLSWTAHLGRSRIPGNSFQSTPGCSTGESVGVLFGAISGILECLSGAVPSLCPPGVCLSFYLSSSSHSFTHTRWEDWSSRAAFARSYMTQGSTVAYKCSCSHRNNCSSVCKNSYIIKESSLCISWVVIVSHLAVLD